MTKIFRRITIKVYRETAVNFFMFCGFICIVAFSASFAAKWQEELFPIFGLFNYNNVMNISIFGLASALSAAITSQFVRIIDREKEEAERERKEKERKDLERKELERKERKEKERKEKERKEKYRDDD